VGLVRQFESFETRPTHPLTGAPADYVWVHNDGKKTPHWYAGHVEKWNRARDLTLQWFKPGEIAKAMGITPRRVRQLIEQGKMRATLCGCRYYIRGADVPIFVASQTKIAPMGG